MPDQLAEINQRRDGFIDSLLARFERELQGILAAAEAHTVADLSQKLSLTNGIVDRTVANAKILRQFDQIFMDAMDRAGYNHLLNELVQQFPGELPYFQEILKTISANLKTPLPKIDFGPRDLKLLADQAFSAKDSLADLVNAAANQAQQKILLSFGGMKFKDLAVSLTKQLNRAVPEVIGLAETSAATYYRVIADRQYQIIEDDLPSMEIRYRYFGPYDLLCRPFCERLMRLNKTYTRAQIDQMSNGQIPNVFVSCGGYRCRHQFLVALD